MRVLVEADRWCEKTVLTPKIGGRWGAQMCVDNDGAPDYGACGGATQCGTSATADSSKVSVLLCTVTFNANLAHNLTRSP